MTEMQHGEKGAHDAIKRATSSYAPRWHPILETVEVEPGVWHLVAQYGHRYGVVMLIEIAGERGYRATTWAERSQDRQLIGYYRTLLTAVKRTHMAWVRDRGRMGGINGDE